MDSVLKSKCDLFAENREVLRKTLKWEADMMLLAGCAVFTCSGQNANQDTLLECRQILKENTGVLSDFRGHAMVPLLCKMAVSGSPKRYLEGVRELADRLKEQKMLKWVDSSYRILPAMTVYEYIGGSSSEKYLERLCSLYGLMKKSHPWLTGGEDVPFAAMMAVSDYEVEDLIKEAEDCYALLKPVFKDDNARQSLSHVLSLSKEDSETKCDRTMELWNILKEKKHRYSSGLETAVLGVATLTGIPADRLADSIIEADEYLKGLKGFGGLSMSDGQRRLFAAMLTICASNETEQLHAADTTAALQAAMQVEMEICMLIMMSTAVNVATNAAISASQNVT